MATHQDHADLQRWLQGPVPGEAVKSWGKTPADDVRLGNVIEWGHLIGEVTAIRPVLKTPAKVCFDLRDEAPVELYRDTEIQVYR